MTPPPAHDMPMVVHPGYLAGPGDAPHALHTFAKGREDWTLTPVDNQLVAAHQQHPVLLTLDLDAGTPRWTMASLSRPAGQLEWHATFDARTPAEVVTAAARRLAYALAQSTDAERDRQLWGHDHPAVGTVDALDAETARTHHWIRVGDLRTTLTLDSPDGTAAVRVHRFVEGPGSDPLDTVFTLRAGARGHQGDWWRAEFSRYTPTAVLLAAVRTVTEPGRYERRASQIPMLHRSLLRTHPVARRRPQARP
ncbi:DUF317 domain-containing protein [Kitasatospora sp. NPDC058170]|uniref:DUF317 domain-containing protein n=1 Tax=Kitasatospora sp. NPDC058170 TaxID=3346364 RepID=UPI0036DADAAE